jgi:NAD(P)-dependent dehydrogenase (short-subunit alcohol dehydrogenase family)
MIHRIWPRLKIWRKLAVGPIAFIFRFDRSPRITAGMVRPNSEPQRRDNQDGRAAEWSPEAVTADLRPNHDQPGTAVIVGVGPGFGYALARRLALEGFDLALVSRDAAKLAPLVEELSKRGRRIASIGGDVTDETTVKSIFNQIQKQFGAPSMVVYSLQDSCRDRVLEVSVSAFERAWRHNCFGPFLVARHAGSMMQAAKAGSIFFIGSTSSLIGRAEHLTLAVGKFGQRALAQVMARELWPSGVHVAHIVIDADISQTEAHHSSHPQSEPDHIAISILAVHRQPKTAWSSEIDLRPWNERFWEHC